MSGHRAVSRRTFAIAGSLAVCALITGRIWQVNANAYRIPVIRHKMGEWVELDGTFLTFNGEHTEGYSLRVDQAEVISYNEYMRRYALEPAEVLHENEEKYDSACVPCLTITMKNDNNSDGYFHMFGALLTCVKPVNWYRVNMDMLEETERAYKGKGNGIADISLRPDTEYTLHVPFLQPNYDPVIPRIFEWRVSNLPVRHVIDIVAE
ncbi:MAG: DUF5028 domain-containing protein [Coriobacteriales bacterium]|nr:DUF5028 domain-containing protein [Coriobacteriales bacterium]